MNYTLQDIADMIGVSKVTVHKAIYGKPGVSKETRERILNIVKEVGYTVDPVASSLKRDQLKIAVVLPQLEPSKNYFYLMVDEGINTASEELKKFRVSIVRYYCDDTWESQAEILDEIIEKRTVDGVVIYCNDAVKPAPYFQRLKEINIPVITFHSDTIYSCRIGSVTAPARRCGRLSAELMDGFIHESGHILVLGGNKSIKVLQDTVAGFFEYMCAQRPDLSILEINDSNSYNKIIEETQRLINALGDVKGIYCNSARNNLPLCRMISNLGYNDIKIITSDVYKELGEFFESKVINATIWQNPQAQSYKAILNMYQYLTTQQLDTPCETVPVAVVMQSNFEDYCI